MAVVGMRIYPGTPLFAQAVAEGVIQPGADLLAPEGYGEIIGGSQREDVLEKLLHARFLEARDGEGLELNRGTLVLQVPVELHGVEHLLVVLDHEPLADAVVAGLGHPGRHGHIEIGREHLSIDLLVNPVRHFLGNHNRLRISQIGISLY